MATEPSTPDSDPNPASASEPSPTYTSDPVSSSSTTRTNTESSNDKLLAALTYPIPIIGIIILVSDSMKNNPYLRVHAVQSLALGVALFIGSIIISFTGIGACLAPFIWLGITLYYAYQAYQGRDVNIPLVTEFCRNQKWI